VRKLPEDSIVTTGLVVTALLFASTTSSPPEKEGVTIGA